jgi:hypothetical protein
MSGLCKVPECGRGSFARELCQTHHRQWLTTGKVKPIRPYRKRSPGTMKFAGLRLTPHCVAMVDAYAKQRGLSEGAAIAEILEGWRASHGKPVPTGGE